MELLQLCNPVKVHNKDIYSFHEVQMFAASTAAPTAAVNLRTVQWVSTGNTCIAVGTSATAFALPGNREHEL